MFLNNHEMKNSFYIQSGLFLFSLVSSMIICLSSNSFLSMWMSMEINLFSIIPLISTNQKIFSEKSTMLYFLIQGISSSIIIITIVSNIKLTKSIMLIFIFMAIFMKLGMSPFHFWMISMIEGIKWNLAFMIMTVQKIIPICILMFFIHQKVIIFMCLMNSMIVALSGITMYSMRKIMGFSSINHLSLMLISMVLSKKIFKMYFLIYSLMTLSATKSMQMMNMNFLSQTMTVLKMSKINNLNNLIIFMSMAGIPPFLGFMPKLITIMLMMKSSMIISVLMILFLNTITTFLYLRVSLNNILMNLNLKKTMKVKKETKLALYLLFSPLYLFMLWNFKLMKLLIFKIKIK